MGHRPVSSWRLIVPAPAIRSTHGERLHGYTDNGCGEAGTHVPTTDYRPPTTMPTTGLGLNKEAAKCTLITDH